MPRKSILKDILSIEKFKLSPEEVAEVYPRAYALPVFFSHNLLSPKRVVKYFQGAQALVGAFYYQLMKLALQLQPEDINYRDLIFRKFVQFDLFGEGELEDDLFSDFQYRKFVKDFIEIVQREDVPNFEKTAQLYPIIDEILIKYFRIILPMPLLMELEKPNSKSMDVARDVLSFLCKEFQITLSEIGPCFKLEESDTFIYFQSLQEVFLAYDQITVEPVEDEDSEFTSTFECGDGNSFLTKYHTQSAQSPLHTRQKPEKSQKNSILLLDTKENIGKFQSIRKKDEHLDFTAINSKVSQERWEKSILETKISSQATVPFKQLSSLLNRDIKTQHPTLAKPTEALYSEFTDSLILKEMPTLYRDGIRNIKDKYKRASIRKFM